MREHHQLTPGHILRDLFFVVATIVAATIAVVALGSCAEVPKDFQPGAQVKPPQGCIDQRARNAKAEC